MLILAEGPLSKLYGIEESDTQLPKGEVVVGKNGVFKIGGSPIFDIIKPAEVVFNGFKVIQPLARMAKKIPWDKFWLGPAWIKKQWKKRGRVEYMLILFYHPEKDEYIWYPPVQVGSSGAVEYSISDDEDVCKLISLGWTIAGSMHNHFGNKGSAFQSGTDEHDEQRLGAAGVHFTMGFLDASSLFESEFHIRIVDGKFDKIITIDDCVDQPPIFHHPDEWDNKLKVKATIAPAIPVITANSQYDKYPTYTRPYNPVHLQGHYHKQDYKKKEEERTEGKGWKTLVTGLGSRQGFFSAEDYFVGTKKGNTTMSSNGNTKIGNDFDRAKEEEQFEVLCDVPIIKEVPEDSPVFEQVMEKYPDIYGLAGGEYLLQAISIAKVMFDGTQYALIEEDEEGGTDREDLLEKTIEELGSSSMYIIELLKKFFDDQTEQIQADKPVIHNKKIVEASEIEKLKHSLRDNSGQGTQVV
jgi:hypothetical protein